MKILLLFLLSCGVVFSYNNGVARTPPMGWNSWNWFGCETSLITEDMFKEMAKAMATNGMKDVGYEYINLDDCWLAATRNSSGYLQPDPKRFPSGIKALADYVHSLGLKFGIYEDIGNQTCGGWPGSPLPYFEIDAKTYAEWGVDYVKLDGCNLELAVMPSQYTEYSKALNQTGRQMVYSCSWPAYATLNNVSVDYSYIGTICNLWREWYDVTDKWESWTAILDFQIETNLNQFSGPGRWNDPDMLEIGNGGQTDDEYRALFSIWAILAAPLIAGNDLRNMTQSTLEILTAAEVIAVDQDVLGIQGGRVAMDGQLEVYARPLSGNKVAVVLFNRSAANNTIIVAWEDIGLDPSLSADVRDLWAQKDLGSFKGQFSSPVRSHAAVMITVAPPQ